MHACLHACTHAGASRQKFWSTLLCGPVQWLQMKVLHSDKFYYVPLIDSIQNLLTLEDFQAEVLHPHNIND